MTLLGIDVGTTGCKAAVFSLEGAMLGSAYREYDVQRPHPGWAELDAVAVWTLVQETIREVTQQTDAAAIQALAVSSMGEAVVPVTRQREILGPSLLNFDIRGQEYLSELGAALNNEQLYLINGNTLGNHYSLTKIKWIKQHQPAGYERTDLFLHWSCFVAFMLGAEPILDYSLANRTLLFDLERGTWSDDLLDRTGLDREKLPRTVPSGTPIGTVAPHIAAELGLPPQVVIVAGAHDQCATAVGCGVIEPGSAVYALGTYLCITPVFTARPASTVMIERGLNTEHHAVPGCFVSFLYNHGGSIVKWFRDTFAKEEYRRASQNIYNELFAEIPHTPSRVLVLPHFSATGPPEFISDSCGVMVGMQLDTQRGEILKGIIEGASYYLKECVDSLPATGITIQDYQTVGGGSKSDVWVQTCADIMGTTISRPIITEAGALGAAIMAAVGNNQYATFQESVGAMVKLDRHFEADPRQHQLYQERYEYYKQLWPLTRAYLRDVTTSAQSLEV